MTSFELIGNILVPVLSLLVIALSVLSLYMAAKSQKEIRRLRLVNRCVARRKLGAAAFRGNIKKGQRTREESSARAQQSAFRGNIKKGQRTREESSARAQSDTLAGAQSDRAQSDALAGAQSDALARAQQSAFRAYLARLP